MKCKQIRSLIYDYEDGTADRVTHSAIEEHLSGCAACRLHYETQRRLHRSMTEAVSSELAGLHFKPMPVKEEPSGERRPSPGMWPRRTAIAASCFLIICTVTWVLWKQVPKPSDEPAPSAYAEAYHYFDMYQTDSPNKSGFATPLAIIIRPGVPVRIIELDGTTNVSDAFK